MAKEQFSKKDLEAVATDLNKIFEQPIPTGRKATITSLKKDLIEAAQEIQTNDVISDKSKEILTALGAKLPGPIAENSDEKGKPGKPAVKKAGNKNEPGVIASILEFIKSSKEGITIPQIQEKLASRFADRDTKAMLKTIKAQIRGKKSPCRMEKEKKVAFNIADGKYSVKE